ncbi:NACHT domain-containing protein [Sesbania bispinosa]|nr:NACHT domain-containing protein [Sesbania bispinosa]
MASKQHAKLAEKLAKKNVVAARKKDIRDSSEQEAQITEKSRPKRQRVASTPVQEIPVTQAPAKLLDQLFRGALFPTGVLYILNVEVGLR